MTVSIVIPTLARREASLERALASLGETCPAAEVIVPRDHPTVGEAWNEGANAASGDYIHLGADDLVWKAGWWEAAAEVCDRGALPVPLVWNTDGSVQSCGDVMDAVVPDGTVAAFPRVAPFLSRAQWAQLGPLPPIHYFTEQWVGARAADFGIPSVVCHGYSFVHDLGMVEVGWREGLTWQTRLAEDRERFAEHRRRLKDSAR